MLDFMSLDHTFLHSLKCADLTSVWSFEMHLDVPMQVLWPFIFLATGTCKAFMNLWSEVSTWVDLVCTLESEASVALITHILFITMHINMVSKKTRSVEELLTFITYQFNTSVVSAMMGVPIPYTAKTVLATFNFTSLASATFSSPYTMNGEAESTFGRMCLNQSFLFNWRLIAFVK